MEIKRFFMALLIFSALLSGMGFVLGDLASSYKGIQEENLTGISRLAKTHQKMRSYRAGGILTNILNLIKLLLQSPVSMFQSMITATSQMLPIPTWVTTLMLGSTLIFIIFALIPLLKYLPLT